MIHKARWIMIDPYTIIEDGYIRVESGLIREIGKGRLYSAGDVADHGPGVLMSKPVNAHTHLELCALKGKLTFDKGFLGWVSQLISQRETETKDNLIAASKAGVQELSESGCGLVGDISGMRLTWKILSDSPLSGVWFQEYLGGSAHKALYELSDIRRIRKSYSGHAPHTTAPDLLVSLKQETARFGLPFSIHVSESEEETEFITTGKGRWADFLTQRGIGFSDWEIPARSPIVHLDRFGLLDHLTLAVHTVFADRADYDILRRRRTPVCVCVRSSLNLHKQAPDIPEMLDAGITPCLGTDSLASCESLSILDEMAAAARQFPSVPPEKIIEMATIAGASALGFENQYGNLTPGKKGDLLYLDIKASGQFQVAERIVHFSNYGTDKKMKT